MTRCCMRSGRRLPTSTPISVPSRTVPTLMSVPVTTGGENGSRGARRPHRLAFAHRRAAHGGRCPGGFPAAGRGFGVGRNGAHAAAVAAHDGGAGPAARAFGPAGRGRRRPRGRLFDLDGGAAVAAT